MVSVQFRKNFTGPPFCGGWTKKLQTFSRHFFWEQPSKYCIAEFTAIFVCLLLSWSRRYSTKWSSNFDGPWPLYLIFLNIINLCLNIWFIKNSECSQFFHLKKEPPKEHKFFIFRRLLFRNGQPYWYECWRILREFFGFSKSNFSQNIARLMSKWMSKVGQNSTAYLK